MTKEVKDVAEVVSNEKYYLHGETFDKMSERIGMFMGLAEKEYELMFFWGTKFTDLIKNKKFIPGGRILANAGTYFDKLNESQKKAYSKYIKNYNSREFRCGQMLNCYVIPIKDSKHGPSSIYESLEDAADITAMEGGVGENFSELRPAGSPIRGNPSYKSSGPISFLKLYDANSKQLKQGGGRRGANMAILDCDHPDIFEFVDCKRKEGEIDNYNISIGIYDKFMDAVDNDEMWDLKWNNMIYRTVSARSLFEKIVYNIWADGGGGEPGVIFLDTANKSWPFLNEKPKTTNPCGEQFLGNYEACDLGAINLVSYVLFNTSTNKFEFDYKSFKEDIYTAIRFLDNVLDLNNYPLKYRNNVCETISMNHRRIGLGIMGLSDSLMLLGCEYGSNESIEVIKSIMNVFNSEAKLASVNLGNEKGLFLDQENAKDEFKHRRNCCVTTIAPTGTTSMLVGVSSGCEPNFGLVVKKKTTDGSGNVYFMVSESFKKLCSFNKIDLTDERLNEIYENKGSVQGLSWVPKYIQSIAKTTMDISPLDHVKVQCELQKYIENSISKTINLPRTATQKDVEDCIFSLWRGGAKGGTIYRDGTRQFQIMNVGGSESKQIVNNKYEEKPENRPDVLKGKTYKMVTNITTHKPENTYITINEDSTGRPFELFVHGSYDQSIINFLDFLINNGVKHDLAQMICAKMSQMSKENIGATTRLVSLCLRNNVPIVNVIKQLRKISNSDLYSIHKKIAKILSSYVGEKIKLDKCQNIIDNNPCGGNLMYQEGCLMCDLCGASKCE